MRIEIEIPDGLVDAVVERWMQGNEQKQEENVSLVECAIPVEAWLHRRIVSGLGVRIAQEIVNQVC